jgi:nitroimidazol reductase NimA-like FMN-containing flavoprotein (pyridoxamine 5'-phosphate oxidase superfamily)
MTSDPASAATEVLNDSECWSLLSEAVVGRLAVTLDGQPDIFPVNPVVDHGTIVFRTAAGTKLAAAEQRDVAFEIDGYDVDDGTAWSVVVKGRADQITGKQEIARAQALPLFPWQEGRKSRFVRIEPTTISGRRFSVVGGKRTPVSSNDGGSSTPTSAQS